MWYAIILSALFIFILAHITVDKEFDQGMKVGAYIVIGLISILYLVFGVIV